MEKDENNDEYIDVNDMINDYNKTQDNIKSNEGYARDYHEVKGIDKYQIQSVEHDNFIIIKHVGNCVNINNLLVNKITLDEFECNIISTLYNLDELEGNEFNLIKLVVKDVGMFAYNFKTYDDIKDIKNNIVKYINKELYGQFEISYYGNNKKITLQTFNEHLGDDYMLEQLIFHLLSFDLNDI